MQQLLHALLRQRVSGSTLILLLLLLLPLLLLLLLPPAPLLLLPVEPLFQLAPGLATDYHVLLLILPPLFNTPLLVQKHLIHLFAKLLII